jgi:glycosyltransferase involved in cell wall biosynthesis
MQHKRLLLISHSFPPYLKSPGGAIRFAKFIKYITRQRPEWQIDVITAGFCGFEDKQPKAGQYLLEDIPQSVRIFRIDDPFYADSDKNFENKTIWISEVKKSSRSWALRYPGIYNVLRRIYQEGKQILKSSFQKKVDKPEILTATKIYPDSHIVWHDPVLKWLDLQEKNYYDLIFVTIPSVSTALLGVEIKKKLGIPLVVDVRDDWADYWKPGSEKERVEMALERSVVQMTDLLVVVSPEIEESYRSRHQDISKVLVIRNGVDLEDFAGLWQIPLPFRFVITYVGNVEHRSPVTFLRAFQRLCNDLDVDSKRCEVRLPDYLPSEWWQAVLDLGLTSHVRSVPMLERDAYLKLLAESSLLLIIQTEGRKGAIAAKTFEYWASGRPILYLDEKSIGTDLVEQNYLGYTAHPDDIDAIYGALRRLYFEHCSGRDLHKPSDSILNYSREVLTRRLIENLDELL